MGKVRPVGIVLIAIWFFIASLIAIAGGAIHAFAYQWFFGALGLVLSLLGGPGAASQVIQILLLVIGIVLVASGIAYLVMAFGLLQGSEWGRTGGIAAAIGGTIGWIAFGILTLVGAMGLFSVTYIVLGLLNALPVLYLVSDEARQYCGGFSNAVPAWEPTVSSAPTPLPVMAPPVSTSRAPQPVLDGTEIIGAAQPPAAWLVMRGGNRPGKEFGLQRGRNTIGRDGVQCNVVLDDTTISKRHAEVRYENGQFVLYDLASTNGTFVNNRRVQKQSLLDDDDVRVGNVALVFKQVKMRPSR